MQPLHTCPITNCEFCATSFDKNAPFDPAERDPELVQMMKRTMKGLQYKSMLEYCHEGPYVKGHPTGKILGGAALEILEQKDTYKICKSAVDGSPSLPSVNSAGKGFDWRECTEVSKSSTIDELIYSRRLFIEELREFYETRHQREKRVDELNIIPEWVEPAECVKSCGFLGYKCWLLGKTKCNCSYIGNCPTACEEFHSDIKISERLKRRLSNVREEICYDNDRNILGTFQDNTRLPGYTK